MSARSKQRVMRYLSKRVLITASLFSHIALFHCDMAGMLRDNGYEVHAAAFNDLADKEGLRLRNIDKEFEICFKRSPFKASNIKAYRQMKRVLSENTYDIIHCNSPVGGMLTRLAARKLRKHGTKVIYTAHGFHFFKGAPPQYWLLYYPAERLMARFTDVLITINEEDFGRAKGFKAGRTEHVRGIGIDVDRISGMSVDRAKKREELGIHADATVLLSVGELNRTKNHEVALRSLAMLQEDIHYIICGCGALESYLKELADKLRIGDNVHFLGFRADVTEICKASDIFVFPSVREGLSVALVEAMACGLPVVCSNIRGNSELIQDGKGGYLCSPLDVDGFAKAISMLINGDSATLDAMGAVNYETAKAYSVSAVMGRIGEIYRECGGHSQS